METNVKTKRISGEVVMSLANDDAEKFSITRRPLAIELPEECDEDHVDLVLDGAMYGILRSIAEVRWMTEGPRTLKYEIKDYSDDDSRCRLIGEFVEEK